MADGGRVFPASRAAVSLARSVPWEFAAGRRRLLLCRRGARARVHTRSTPRVPTVGLLCNLLLLNTCTYNKITFTVPAAVLLLFVLLFVLYKYIGRLVFPFFFRIVYFLP